MHRQSRKGTSGMLSGGFQLAGGTIPGRDHIGRNEVLLGRNNQDAFRWKASDEVITAVVTDGCGSKPHSDVGAQVGAEFLLNAVMSRVRDCSSSNRLPRVRSEFEALLEDVRLDMLGRLTNLARQLAGSEGSIAEALTDYLLFTVTGLLVTEAGTVFFSIGDGVWALNGEVRSLGPFPQNAPPYLSYGLLSEKTLSACFDVRFQVYGPFATEIVESALIGTDGVTHLCAACERTIPGSTENAGELRQFWEADAYFSNPDAIRRRLSVINREVKRFEEGAVVLHPGLLRDDTTLVVLRRKPPVASVADQDEMMPEKGE